MFIDFKPMAGHISCIEQFQVASLINETWSEETQIFGSGDLWIGVVLIRQCSYVSYFKGYVCRPSCAAAQFLWYTQII